MKLVAKIEAERVYEEWRKSVIGAIPDDAKSRFVELMTEELERWHSLGEVYGAKCQQERIVEAIGMSHLLPRP